MSTFSARSCTSFNNLSFKSSNLVSILYSLLQIEWIQFSSLHFIVSNSCLTSFCTFSPRNLKINIVKILNNWKYRIMKDQSALSIWLQKEYYRNIFIKASLFVFNYIIWLNSNILSYCITLKILYGYILSNMGTSLPSTIHFKRVYFVFFMFNLSLANSKKKVKLLILHGFVKCFMDIFQRKKKRNIYFFLIYFI